MKMSDIGRAVLMAREGVRLQAYQDTQKMWTLGAGHTAACGAPIPKAGMMISPEECDTILAHDLERFERVIEVAITVPYSQNEWDAILSLTFNAGPAVAHSTIIKRLNAGDRKGAADAFLMWNKPAEILTRRQAERVQFMTPYEKSLPKARSSDKAPIKAPAVKAAPKPVAPAPAQVATANPGVIARFLGAFSSRG